MSDEKLDLCPYGVNKTNRLTVPAAEEVLFVPQEFPHGFVRLVDYMGGDNAVLHAITGGVGRELVGEIPFNELFDTARDMGAVNGFKFAEIKVHAKMPIQSALYWMYVEDLSGNEYSGRYSVMLDSGRTLVQKDLEEVLVHRLSEVKGKEGDFISLEDVRNVFAGAQVNARKIYESLLEKGFARELARIGLGLGTHTVFYLSGNLEQWMNAIARAKNLGDKHPHLRYLSDEAQQFENIVSRIAPEAVASFVRDWTAKLSPIDIKLNLKALEQNPDGSPRYGISDTKRITVDSGEQLLWTAEKYLDSGWFMPTDYMGGDESVVQSARTSYGRGTTKTSEDKILLRFLRRHRHSTPSHAVEVQVEQQTPLFVWPRQGGRHRTMDKEGVFNCFVPLNEFYVVPDDQIRKQSLTNRQGRGSLLDEELQRGIRRDLESSIESERRACKELEAAGLREEFIWALKGVGHYTRGTVKVDLHNALHFLGLRNDPHAQHEIQLNAQQWEKFVSAVAPHSVQAFVDYERNAVSFSGPDLGFVARALTEGKTKIPDVWYKESGWTKKDGATGERVLNREAEELNAKFRKVMSAAKQKGSDE